MGYDNSLIEIVEGSRNELCYSEVYALVLSVWKPCAHEVIVDTDT
jgi:hypothetical protein